MFEISKDDRERLLKMAAAAAANLAVEFLLATEPFKSSLPPRHPVLEIPQPKPVRKRRRKTTNKPKCPPTG